MSDVAYLYQIVNVLDGMQYIGVTKNPKVRFRGHAFHNIKTRSFLKAAIKKYGAENFKMNILLIGSRSYCYEMEKKVIEAYNTQQPNGYNICSGGIGAAGLVGAMNGMHGRTGKKHPHFGKPGYNLGRKLSEETKEKMRLAHLGKPMSEEARLKLISARKAQWQNPEYKEKMRNAGFGVSKKKGVTA